MRQHKTAHSPCRQFLFVETQVPLFSAESA
jgi:hypothetical protein